ncbi:hypothetical protein C8Q79DRAFT_897924 [Trametes meyenii]|nr:hypothetical protein C8Q79DRAFT_897924 [Trametes meyenii]
MGVPGLWEILKPAGKLRSLTHIAVEDGFEANPDGKRGFRIGIDASIWFYHAAYGREGENPELRTLFFRCARLMSMPFLPLFVFDGPKRPEMKRGKRISGKNHWMVQGMQEMIMAFGFEWRMAPGEAEAELAYLNRIGVIDAVLSDDVDNFLFGAKTVFRNPSVNLSGNRKQNMENEAGKEDGQHVMVYRSSDILHRADIQLTQGGLILMGILCGGDYCQEGLDGCGVSTAHGLAKCGFGDALLTAARSKSRDELEEFLDGWRDDLRTELRTNAGGHLPRKSPKLAGRIPEDFPDIDVVLAYTNPITSEAKGAGHRNVVVDWDKEPDLGRIAALCEMYFEWGVREIIIKRFRTVLWPSAVLRILRRAVILKDRQAALVASKGAVPATPRKNGKERRAPPSTPSSMIAEHFSTMRLDSPQAHRGAALTTVDDEDEDEDPLIVKIHSSRQHASTDRVLEYRLEIAPRQLVRLCEEGMKGLRTALPPDLSDSDDNDDDGSDGESGAKRKKKGAKKPPPDPDSRLRMWLPACMVAIVEPEMVDEFEGVQKMKADKKANKVKGKAAATGTQKRKGRKAVPVAEEEESGSDSCGAEGSKPAAQPLGKVKATSPAAQKARKPAATSEAADKAGPSQKVDTFFAAKKTTAANTAKPKPAKSTTSTTSKIADLFRDEPSSSQSSAPTLVLTDDSDDEVPRPFHSSPSPAKPAISRVKPISSQTSSSRILNFLDTHTTTAATAAGLAKPSTSMPASASVSTSSPSKSRALRPFPMEFDLFKNEPPQPSPIDEDLFTTGPGSSGSGSGSVSRSGSLFTRTRSRSTLSSDSDSRKSALQKSPRRSEKHASPRSSPPKGKALRREEEESSSDSDSDSAPFGGTRAPSPSPLKGRLPTALVKGPSPAPSPIRARVLPTNASGKQPVRAWKPAPLPADLTVISISSDSEDELPPLGCKAEAVAPLQQARARITKNATISTAAFERVPRPYPRAATQPTATSSASVRNAARKPPRRHYDPDDVIDLT